MLKSDVEMVKGDDFFKNILWMKHKNGYWYASSGNAKRWHCLYSEVEAEARENWFNGQKGPELFLADDLKTGMQIDKELAE